MTCYARVTVGVDVPVRSEGVLRWAVAAARSRGATLHALHAWKLAGIYEDVVVARAQAEEWADRAAADVRAAMTQMVEASGGSDLLVIGRHDPLVPLGSHLGPVARGVLHDARCPVLLVDPHGPATGRGASARSD